MRWTRVRLIAVSLVLVALAFLTGCEAFTNLFGPESSWTLVGTWVNPAYEQISGANAKLVYTETTWAAYKLVSDTTPVASGSYTITKDWTESGVHWFQTAPVVGGSTVYELDRLSSDGNMYESVDSSSAYPTSIDPTSDNFAMVRFRM